MLKGGETIDAWSDYSIASAASSPPSSSIPGVSQDLKASTSFVRTSISSCRSRASVISMSMFLIQWQLHQVFPASKNPTFWWGLLAVEGGWFESDLLLRSVVITRLWLVVSGLLVDRLWIGSALIGGLLHVSVSGLVVDGLNSGWIGIAHGAIAVGALLLLLQLEFHLEQFDFLLLLDEG